MADKLKVRAVDGRLCPHEYSLEYVGWRPAADGDSVGHVIPRFGVDGRGGSVDLSIRLTRTDDVVEVPNNIYYRRAIAVGDLEQVSDAPTRSASVAPKKGN